MKIQDVKEEDKKLIVEEFERFQPQNAEWKKNDAIEKYNQLMTRSNLGFVDNTIDTKFMPPSIINAPYKNNHMDSIALEKIDLNYTKKVLEFIESQNPSEHRIVASKLSLAGHIKKESFMPKDDKIWKPLKHYLKKNIQNLLQLKVKSFDLETIWFNEMRMNDYNPLHQHSGQFSFVWFVDIPDEIYDDDSFQSTRSCGKIIFATCRSAATIEIRPNTGDLILFDSLQQHQVYPFHKDVRRITVAGNIENVLLEDGENIKEYLEMIRRV